MNNFLDDVVNHINIMDRPDSPTLSLATVLTRNETLSSFHGLTQQRLNLIAVIMKDNSLSDHQKLAMLRELPLPCDIIDLVFQLTHVLNP